ncbi:MAG TPA: hypothetical protein VGG01_20060 [Xanthobacteraceae bacterium]|jgi:hypothetical protein
MRKLALLVPLLLAAEPALAGSTSGNSALALAALVGERSPALEAQEKEALGSMLDSNLNFAFPADRKIAVKADGVVCRASNVDISANSCELTFGKRKISRTGRAAHELYATLIEAGVSPEGAASATIAGISKLACTIDPNTVKAAGGGGAACAFSAGE